MSVYWNNHITQPSIIPYTILRPVITTISPNKTIKEQTVCYYDEMIIAIMKAMGLNNIMHCTDKQY